MKAPSLSCYAGRLCCYAGRLCWELWSKPPLCAVLTLNLTPLPTSLHRSLADSLTDSLPPYVLSHPHYTAYITHCLFCWLAFSSTVATLPLYHYPYIAHCLPLNCHCLTPSEPSWHPWQLSAANKDDIILYYLKLFSKIWFFIFLKHYLSLSLTNIIQLCLNMYTFA